MKKIILFLLLIPSISFAAAPTRTSTYTSSTTIRSADVTGNEDAIFNYLQGGVDVIKDGSVVNADINSSASISNSKLNLTTVTQDITHSGTLVQSGTLTSSGTSSFASADINGGSIDGLAIGATTPSTATFTTITTSNALGLLYGGTGSKLIAPATSSIMFVAGGGTVDFAVVGKGLSLSSKTLTSSGNSTVLFAFALGGSSHVADSNGVIVNDSITAADGSQQPAYWAGNPGGAYTTVITTKFIKTSGVSTVTIYGNIWNSSTSSPPDRYAILKVIIGTTNGTVNGTASQVTGEWKNFDIDVSSLTNGTIYDVTIQLANSNDGVPYLDSIIAFGS
jgi:hypothetical protein